MNPLDLICQKIASCIPRAIQYWVIINMSAEVTTGKYSDTVVPELTLMEALRRFEET